MSNADQGTISILSYGLPPTTYAVTLTEQGLPSGTTWSGTLGGITLTSTTENLTFMEPNGTYSVHRRAGCRVTSHRTWASSR